MTTNLTANTVAATTALTLAEILSSLAYNRLRLVQAQEEGDYSEVDDAEASIAYLEERISARDYGTE